MTTAKSEARQTVFADASAKKGGGVPPPLFAVATPIRLPSHTTYRMSYMTVA